MAMVDVDDKRGKGSPYSIAERRVPELFPVLGSQPAGDVSHKPGGRLPLLSASLQLPPQPLRGLLTIWLLGEPTGRICEPLACDAAQKLHYDHIVASDVRCGKVGLGPDSLWMLDARRHLCRRREERTRREDFDVDCVTAIYNT